MDFDSKNNNDEEAMQGPPASKEEREKHFQNMFNV